MDIENKSEDLKHTSTTRKRNLYLYLILIILQISFFSFHYYAVNNLLVVPYFTFILFFPILIVMFMLYRDSLPILKDRYKKSWFSYLLLMLTAGVVPIVFMYTTIRLVYFKGEAYFSFKKELLKGVILSLVLGTLMAIPSNDFYSAFISHQLGASPKYFFRVWLDLQFINNIEEKINLKDINCIDAEKKKFKCGIQLFESTMKRRPLTNVGIVLALYVSSINVFNEKDRINNQITTSVILAENVLSFLELSKNRSDFISQNISFSFLNPADMIVIDLLHVGDSFIKIKLERTVVDSILSPVVRNFNRLPLEGKDNNIKMSRKFQEYFRENPDIKRRIARITSRVKRFKAESLFYNIPNEFKWDILQAINFNNRKIACHGIRIEE